MTFELTIDLSHERLVGVERINQNNEHTIILYTANMLNKMSEYKLHAIHGDFLQ